ncbi:response regulator [Rhizobium ruizarguesonis]|jgi:two-component system OmpR family response regulator|uniref:response regulator n=1 Tax=Rhizobium ruizarguesonis TaxID=2081791 RepID=UPI001032213F|nr:response regulator [Rhizobium ruizarguesonis]NEH81555.1 response regulator [Rhizobium ruizarguesonis]NEJ18077.1 response regulator [Rhizobium ruizarguesonis]NEK25795.1 response regulator [Rhizobium ruizarguesonis]TAW03238.1 response regulator [Rhizobium ruizarguesonis]TAZ44092.1 response regulator [Rhizobium ruizarguesonis]
MAPRILVVDDEPHIRDVICFALERAGLAWLAVRNGTEAMTAFRRGSIDLIILDVGMPDMDGLDVCRQIRKTSGLPILFLSARDEEIDRVLGLEIGGDDYVTKPFSPRELIARVKAILKRSGNGAEPERRHATLVAGALSLDRGARTVTFRDSEIAMTALEFAILDALLSRPDMVFSREQLMEAAYGAGTYVADRTIDSHIRNIRAKFLAAGGQGVIATVHGIGFKLGSEIGRQA